MFIMLDNIAETEVCTTKQLKFSAIFDPHNLTSTN